MKSIQKYLIFSVILALLFAGSFTCISTSAGISDFLSLIFISEASTELEIGDKCYLTAYSTKGGKVSWKSSDKDIASVSSSGVVTAKSPGTAIITAKSSGKEAYCYVTVRQTIVSLDRHAVAMENGASLSLGAWSSASGPLKWKSSKSSVVKVDSQGLITARKPGTARITVSSGSGSDTCTVTVVKPVLTLNKRDVTLYRNKTCQLSCRTSSGLEVTYRSDKPSVASADSEGIITAKKHGTATITASLDGVSTTCRITVKSPDITLSDTSLSLSKGDNFRLTAKVSSGNKPTWTSSNTSVATVDSFGRITAIEAGRAYIYASEDGTKRRCTIKVAA